MKPRWRRNTLSVAASAVVLAALVLGILAFRQLDEVRRDDFYGEVAKLSYQAIVIVVLGAMVKRAFDEAQDRNTRRERDNLRRAEYIRRVIDASHTVELARTYIWANRSVKTWDEQMHKIIAAYVDLRDVRHEVATVSSTDGSVFDDWNTVRHHVQNMERYLVALIDEYSKNKKPLSELQREAERDRSRQDEVWKRLQKLDQLGPFLEGSGYGPFRNDYQEALGSMRGQTRDRPRVRQG